MDWIYLSLDRISRCITSIYSFYISIFVIVEIFHFLFFFLHTMLYFYLHILSIHLSLSINISLSIYTSKSIYLSLSIYPHISIYQYISINLYISFYQSIYPAIFLTELFRSNNLLLLIKTDFQIGLNNAFFLSLCPFDQ